MAGRGRASFQKRQKEQLRMEKRQQKAARRQDRKDNPNKGNGPEIADQSELEEVFGVDVLPEGEELNPAGGLSIPRSDT
ncbi:MAG TPA: hypothetical protein VHA11_10400 [Bryobacteraceae bacterium]|nr:hypothetical protein [Bryobacteraceae bacterium]